MKRKLSFLISVLILSAIILVGRSPAFAKLIPTAEPTLPPTQLPIILPTKPVGYDPAGSISPASGQVGTLVQVLTSGFSPNTPVSVAMWPVNSELDQVAQGITDSNGSFITQVPVQGAPGMELLIAILTEGQPGVLAPDPFHILDSFQPVVSISPTSGESGTLVQVVASGFPTNSPVPWAWDLSMQALARCRRGRPM